MHLHVIAGAHDLLHPAAIDGAELAGLVGPEARIATAFWLSKECGKHDHDFLREDADGRIAVFARSLRDGFGTRFSPVIVLPDLLDEVAGAPAGQPDRLGSLAVLHEILRLCPSCRVTLHAIALPAGTVAAQDGAATGLERLLPSWTGGRLDGLRAAVVAAGHAAEDIGANLIEAGPAVPLSDMLLRNALARRITRRIAVRLAEHHLHAERAALQTAAVRVLKRWDQAGILPMTPIGNADLDRLAGRIAAVLLREGGNG
jgi:hypothetical protein